MMNRRSPTILAIYEKGTFRPLEPVKLPEQTRMNLEIIPEFVETQVKAMVPEQILAFQGRVKWPEDALERLGKNPQISAQS